MKSYLSNYVKHRVILLFLVFAIGAKAQIPSASFVYSNGANGLVNFTCTSSVSHPAYFIWNFGDGTSGSGYTDSISHVYAVIGQYNVSLIVCELDMITMSWNCWDTADMPIIATLLPSSIQTNEIAEVFFPKVYPNPSSGEVIIRSNQAINITITNELGQNVKQFSLSTHNGYTQSVPDLCQGIYFINSRSGEKLFRQKLAIVD